MKAPCAFLSIDAGFICNISTPGCHGARKLPSPWPWSFFCHSKKWVHQHMLDLARSKNLCEAFSTVATKLSNARIQKNWFLVRVPRRTPNKKPFVSNEWDFAISCFSFLSASMPAFQVHVVKASCVFFPSMPAWHVHACAAHWLPQHRTYWMISARC